MEIQRVLNYKGNSIDNIISFYTNGRYRSGVVFMKSKDLKGSVSWSIPFMTVRYNKRYPEGVGYVCDTVEEFWKEIKSNINPIKTFKYLETREKKFLDLLTDCKLDLI